MNRHTSSMRGSIRRMAGHRLLRTFSRLLPAIVGLSLAVALRAEENSLKYILTPPAPQTPRINGAKLFGVRPGHPFLFTIPATGKRPMTFAVENLPAGLTLDKDTGRITGKVTQRGIFVTTIVVQNELGVARREFRIVCGEQIALDSSLLPGTVPRRSGDQVLLPYLPYQILGLRVRSCPATDPSPSNTEKEPEHA